MGWLINFVRTRWPIHVVPRAEYLEVSLRGVDLSAGEQWPGGWL